MKLEDQVVSLEQAKQLKELGVRQESLYYWRGISNNTAPEPENWYYSWRVVDSLETVPSHSNNARLRQYAAFTVAELGEMLPDYITGLHLYSYQQVRSWADSKKPRHQLSYWFMGDIELHSVEADTEADARAKMLIYLLENNLITI